MILRRALVVLRSRRSEGLGWRTMPVLVPPNGAEDRCWEARIRPATAAGVRPHRWWWPHCRWLPGGVCTVRQGPSPRAIWGIRLKPH